MMTEEKQAEEDTFSDVSLEEEDEELIWRVFYSRFEGGTHRSFSERNGNESYALSDEEDISDLEDIDDPVLLNKYRSLKLDDIYNLSEEEKRRLLIANFSNEQMERFESYRRMTVNKPGIKKVCTSVLNHSLPQNISVVLAGLSKLFLGEIITRALAVQEKENKAQLIKDIEEKKKQKKDAIKQLEKDKEIEMKDVNLSYKGDAQHPLQPRHIREAWRLYQLENSGVPSLQWFSQGESDGKLFR